MHGTSGCNFSTNDELISAGDKFLGEFWANLTNSSVYKNKKVRRWRRGQSASASQQALVILSVSEKGALRPPCA